VETGKQVSVFLENKPGRLSNVLSALARERVNIAALTVTENVLRFVANDLPRTIQVLRSLGTRCSETEVLVVELRNQPGALAHICELLAAEHIQIDHCYCSAGAARNGKTLGVFKVSNTDKAMRVLGSAANNAVRRRGQARPPRDRRSYSPPSMR